MSKTVCLIKWAIMTYYTDWLTDRHCPLDRHIAYHNDAGHVGKGTTDRQIDGLT